MSIGFNFSILHFMSKNVEKCGRIWLQFRGDKPQGFQRLYSMIIANLAARTHSGKVENNDYIWL
jgi:hypothetical protein